MAKEILYRIDFEGASEQITNLTKIRDELDQIKIETIKVGQSDKARAEELKIIAQEKSKQYRAEQQAIKDNQREYKATSGTLEQLRLEAKKLGKDLEKSYAVGSLEFKKAAGKLDDLNRKIRNADKSAGNFKSNIGNYAGSIGDAFQGVGLNVGKLTGSLGAATAATGPLGVGLAVLVGGANLFGSALNATDTIADAFAITMQKSKAATQVFFKALAEGDFSNLIDNMRTAIRLAEEYAKALDDLEDRNREFDIAQAKARVKTAAQEKIIADRSQTPEARKAAGLEIIRIETELANTRVSLAQKAFDNESKYIAGINKLSKDQLFDLIENYSQYEKKFEIVAKLQDAERRLANEQANNAAQTVISGDQIIKTKQKQSAEEIRLTKHVNALRAATAGYADYVKQFGSVASEERDKFKDALVELYQAQSSLDELTLTTTTKLGSIENKQSKGLAENSKEIKKLNDAINNLIPTYAKLVDIINTKIPNSIAENIKRSNALFKDMLKGNDTIDENVNDPFDTSGIVNGVGSEGSSLSDRKKDLEEKYKFGLVTQEEYLKKRGALDNEYNQYVYNTAINAAQQFTDVWVQAYANQTASREMELKRQLDAGIISEETYNKKVGELRAKQAKKEKTAAIIQTIINTAQSIVKTGADLGYPLAIPFQVLAGIIGAAQAAVIASQPIPKYAEGGLIAGGKSHSQGGTKFVGSDGSAFEAERGELIAVVNKTDTKRLRQLSDLNSRHGRSFYGQPSANYFASGGIFQPNPNMGSGNQDALIRSIVSQIGNIPVEVSLNEIESKSSLKRKVNVIGSL